MDTRTLSPQDRADVLIHSIQAQIQDVAQMALTPEQIHELRVVATMAARAANMKEIAA